MNNFGPIATGSRLRAGMGGLIVWALPLTATLSCDQDIVTLCEASASSTIATQTLASGGVVGELLQPLVGGSAVSSFVLLSQKESQALLHLQSPTGLVQCTGIQIAPELVLTAAHCVHAANDAGEKFTTDGNRLELVAEHSVYDAALYWSSELNPTIALKLDLEGVPLAPRRILEVAGWGRNARGTTGRLQFGVEEVVWADDEMFEVSANGMAGLCAGDSGGPALIRNASAEVRVVGLLSAGSADCQGTDRFLRTATLRSWLEPWLAPTNQENESTTAARLSPMPCGQVSAEGRCFAQTRAWCEDGEMRVETCAELCGWSSIEQRNACIDRDADLCEGVPALGVCLQDAAWSCVQGRLEATSCDVCGGICSRSPLTGKVGCF